MLKPRLVISVLSLFLLAAPALAQPPGAPLTLSHTVNGTTVVLNWQAPSTGGVPTSYEVRAAYSPGGPIIAQLPVAGTTLTVPNVPNGTYFVHVVAGNASGASAPSNEITVSVAGGCPGPPQPPQFAVRAIGLQVSLSWSSGGGCAPTSYTLLAGSAPGLANIAQVNMGGALALPAQAPAGTYYLRVVGSNPWGSAVSQELTLRLANNAQTDTLGPSSAVAFDVVMTASGTYRGSLVWDDSGIDLDLYLTMPGCNYPPASTCLLVLSDNTGTNNEQVSRSVSAGESYRLWVDNFSNQTTAFTIFSEVSPGASPDEPRGANDLRLKKSKP